jgi:hypothetical protein
MKKGMRHFLSAVAFLFALTTPYVWNVGATGVVTFNRNVCDLARRHISSIPEDCRLDDWIIYLWAALFILSLFALFWEVGRLIGKYLTRRHSLEPLNDSFAYDGDSLDDALQFVFGAGKDYQTWVAIGIYKTMHTFMIGIKNTSKTNFLSNCKLYLDISDHNSFAVNSYCLVDTFTLNATEERYVPIVSYDEPATVSGYKGSIIRLCIPVYGGGALGVGSGWPWQIPVGEYTFTLRATAKEVGAHQVVCKIWVDDAEKLHFEKA